MQFHFHTLSRTWGAAMSILVTAGALLALSHVARVDADAEALLSRASTTLTGARTLSAAFTISTVHSTRYADAQERGTVTLSKPNLARIEITRYRKHQDTDRWIASGNGSTVVADGHDLSTLIWHPKSAQYRTAAASPAAPSRALESLEPLRAFFGNVTSGTVARSIGEKTWENARYTVIEETPSGSAVTGAREFYVGADHLIHRLISHLQIDGKEVVREVALHNIHVDSPVSSEAFRFTPPSGAVAVQSSAPQPLLTNGTEAPDFEVEDAQGRKVHLSDFRGKVVVLKFFATWCWTCNQSLPDTNALAEKYGPDGAVVLAVDIWNSREAFHAWKGRATYGAIHFTHDDRPQGKDSASVLYHVTSIPTEFVIGKDGRIADSHTGYDGPDGALERMLSTVSADSRANGTQ